MKKICLCGGGHSHLFVLRELAQLQRKDLDVTLVTPSRHQTYSGMVPGWMAGYYGIDQCRIDLEPLAEAAGVLLKTSRLQTLDANARTCVLENGEVLSWDLLSLDTGSQTRPGGLDRLGEAFLPVKPLEQFQAKWLDVLDEAATMPGYRLLVAGGGAAGVEIALAAANIFRKKGLDGTVSLASRPESLMAGHAPSVRNRVADALADCGVAVIPFRIEVDEAGILSAGGKPLDAAKIIGATGAMAPDYLQTSGLALDENGFVLVNDAQQSVSHADVFAAGDVAGSLNVNVERSGVHAVRAGPVLAANIVARIDGLPLQPYRARKSSLYLLATGDGRAIMSWGPFSATGRWVWKWKDHIDRAFIKRFSVFDA